MATGLMWFRRDLRLEDNAAFSRALDECDQVHCVFCFDREILDKLEDRADRRVEFIHQSIVEMEKGLKKAGGGLIVRHGRAHEVIPELAEELGVDRVYANHDYEPRRLERDRAVGKSLRQAGRELRTFKDHVVFEKDEVLNKSGKPFRVYTPYKRAWRARLSDEDLAPHSCRTYFPKKLNRPPRSVKSDAWTLKALGFKKTDLKWPGGESAGRAQFDEFLTRIKDYKDERNFPSTEGVSRMSVHLRFGTVSIRELVREAMAVRGKGAETWVDELIWREFYNMILHHFPETEQHAFQPEYEDLPWRKDKKEFAAWCEGRTGYPIVDAAMRELNTTGYMHNRARMITASFLTKDLRIDWKWGERYFARTLLDYDLSQNLGGWQWSASTGTDAQPYFRIFNPISQSKRFDPEGAYIRTYVPELKDYPDDAIHAPWEASEDEQEEYGAVIGRDYPRPMVDHDVARKAALAMFQEARATSRN